MEGSLQGREELLLEHTRNLVQNSYDELGDKQIISSIYDYYLLLEKLNDDKSSISSDELLKLQRLHKLFYNADFDLNEPFKTGTSNTLILDLFKRNFTKIEKLIQETDNTRADILKSLVPLMKVNYYSDKKKKEIVNRYLNEILIPLINSNTQSAIKADKLDETTTATVVATSGTTASSFLSKIKEAANAEKESKKGEEMEGAVLPSDVATTTEATPEKPKEPSTAPGEDDLNRAREIAKAKAFKEQQEKRNVGIGSTGAPGFLKGLIETGLSQGEIDKKRAEGTFSETTPENQKQLFERFFEILYYLATIGSIFDLYNIVFGEDFESKYFTTSDEQSKFKQKFDKPGKIREKLASLNKTKTDNFLLIVQEYMYKVVKEVFDYTKDGLALQKLIADIKEKTADDKLILMETIQIKSNKLNLNKLFMKLFEFLEYYFFLFYFYSNIPDFYIEKNPEIIMKLTEDYNQINLYFMELFEFNKNQPSQITQDVEKKISEFIERQLPTKLENIKNEIIDDLVGKINENHLSSLIKEDTSLPILEITEIPTGSDSRQRGGGEGKLTIIKGGISDGEIKPFYENISDYSNRIEDLNSLYKRFKLYVEYKSTTVSLFKPKEKEELNIILQKLKNLLNELQKETEKKQQQLDKAGKLEDRDEYHIIFLDYYIKICALFQLLYKIFNVNSKQEILAIIDEAQNFTEEDNKLEALYKRTITDYNEGENRLREETKIIINDLFAFENKIYQIRTTLKSKDVEQQSVEKIAEIIQNLNKKQEDLNNKIQTIKEKINEEGKEGTDVKKLKNFRVTAIAARAAGMGAAFTDEKRREGGVGNQSYEEKINELVLDSARNINQDFTKNRKPTRWALTDGIFLNAIKDILLMKDINQDKIRRRLLQLKNETSRLYTTDNINLMNTVLGEALSALRYTSDYDKKFTQEEKIALIAKIEQTYPLLFSIGTAISTEESAEAVAVRVEVEGRTPMEIEKRAVRLTSENSIKQVELNRELVQLKAINIKNYNSKITEHILNHNQLKSIVNKNANQEQEYMLLNGLLFTMQGINQQEYDRILQEAQERTGGGKYQTTIIKGGFPINPKDIYLLALKYMSETFSILQILSNTTLEIIHRITANSIYNEQYYQDNYIGRNNDLIIKQIIDFTENKLKLLNTKINKFIDAITPNSDDSEIPVFLYEYELKEIIKNFKWFIMETFMAFLIELFMIFVAIRKVDKTIQQNLRQNPSNYYNYFKIYLSFLIRYYFISIFKLFYYYNIATISSRNDINETRQEAIHQLLDSSVYPILNNSLNVVIYPHYYYKDSDLFQKNRIEQPLTAADSSITYQRIYDFKEHIQTNNLQQIFIQLNTIKDRLKIAPVEGTAISSNEANFEPFSIYGGGKNGIELAEVFKIFYNFTSSSNNIYSIFFVINCYYKYSKDEDKDDLIKKLKNPNLSLDDLKEHFMKIFEKTKEIFKDYIKTFLKCDSFIKNYYLNPTELIQYLYISFIYDIYKSIKEENINFSLIINKTKIISHKSYDMIKEELKVFFREKHYIFFKDIMPKAVQNNESLKEDIGTFMKFIYNYTDEENNITFTYINNINELFSFITYLFLTLNIPVIKLRINQKNYEIDNIKIHPYSSCSKTIHLPIRIHLNEIEIELMDRLLTSYKHHDLFKVLANEFYYLDLNFKHNRDYKFCINQEIMSFIKPENYDNNLINFSFYEYLPLSSYKSLKLLRINFNKLSFAINYSILLAGSIFTEITTYNYLSLIYLNCYLVKNKHSLPFISFLSYIKDCILVMKNKLKLELTLQRFMDLVINFKKNPFITKMKINEIDMNFIVEVFESKKTSFDLTDNLHSSLNHFMKSIVVPNINKRENRDELIKLMYIYLLPVVEQLTIKGVNTIAIQHDILTIKAMDLLSRLGPISVKKIGGGIEDFQFPKIVPVKNLPELPRDPSRDLNREQTKTQTEPQRDLLQQQLDMSENRTRVSTDPSIDMQAIIKKLQIIGVIKDQIEGMNIAEIEEKYYKKLLDLATVISINKDDRIVVFDTNEIQEEVNKAIDDDRKATQKNDEDDKNKDKRTDMYSKDQKRKVSPGTIAKIDKILINIDKNLSKIKDELEIYGIKMQQSSSSNTLGNSIRDAAKTAEEYISGSTERAKIDKIKENIKVLEATIKSLEAYKDSDNQELRALLKDFKVIVDQKEELNLLAEPKTIVDDFKDFVSGMEKFLEIYVKILKELSNIYSSLRENIKNTRKSLGYEISEERNRGYGYPGFYN